MTHDNPKSEGSLNYQKCEPNTPQHMLETVKFTFIVMYHLNDI